MRIIVSGGGTGGHIYPALAYVRHVKEQIPDVEVLYIGTSNGLEKGIVKKEGLPFKEITISGFKRSLSFENIKTIYRFVKAVSDSKKYIRDFKPDVVIGTGGYVCGPVVYAAAKLGIPTIVHEQNSVPGITNKFLSRYTDEVALCFEGARQFFPSEKCVLTGNPRATEVTEVQQNPVALKKLGLLSDKKTVLIFGGSRGARRINEAVIEAYDELKKKNYQVLFVTGDVHYESVKEELKKKGSSHNVIVVPFIHNMPEIIGCVEAIVSRAGATTLAEVTALGIPTILIPSPYVTNNHQEKNARELEKEHAALVVLEKDLTGSALVEQCDYLLCSPEHLRSMSENARKLGVRDASERLLALTKKVIAEKK